MEVQMDFLSKALATSPLIGVSATLSIVLCVVIIAFYRKSKALKNLAKALEEYQKAPPSLKEINLSADGIPKDVIKPFNFFVQTLKEEHDRLSKTSDQLRSSNLIFSHNIKKFEAMLDAIPEGILLVDLFGHVILANQSLGVFMGVEREKMLGKPLKEWLDRPGWRKFPVSQETDTSFNLKLKGPNSIRNLRATLRRIKTEKMQMGQVFLVKDVTEQVAAELARREFIAHISHELKTPLNSLKSYSEMLMDGEAGDEETRRDFYNTINEEVDRLAHLVDNLMSITKVEMGHLQINRVRVKAGEFFKSIFRAGETQRKGKKISMQLYLPEKLPAIKVDKTLMTVALLNLLSNAIKYTDDGGSVSLKVEDQEDALLFHVIDSGIGISADDLPHVFDKFYRAGDQQVRERGGHGLGLALCQQIIQLHGGEIRVISHLGKGSQFTVVLEKTVDMLE